MNRTLVAQLSTAYAGYNAAALTTELQDRHIDTRVDAFQHLSMLARFSSYGGGPGGHHVGIYTAGVETVSTTIFA